MSANRFQPRLEALEARDTPSATLLGDGTLSVVGTDQADVIRVSIMTDTTGQSQVAVTQTVDGEPTTQNFDPAAVKHVVIRGLAGSDYIRNDTAIPSLIYGGRGADTIWGGSETDLIFGNEGSDHIYGAGGDDLLDGGLGDDVLYGMDGIDTLLGRLGNDSLFGGDGDDRMIGGGGFDNLVGEAGADWMFGVGFQDSALTDPTDTVNVGQGRGLAFRLAAEDMHVSALSIESFGEQTVPFFDRAQLFLHRDI